MTENPASWFEARYAAAAEHAWDPGHAQQTFRVVEAADHVTGRVLDAGCGTGEQSLFFAARGYDVVGVDAAPSGVARARAAAREAGLDASFVVAEATRLPFESAFDTVVDAGLFHALSRDHRRAYVDAVASVLAFDGRFVVLSFGPDAPSGWGPDPVCEGDVLDALGDRWTVETIREAPYETRNSDAPIPGLLSVARLR